MWPFLSLDMCLLPISWHTRICNLRLNTHETEWSGGKTYWGRSKTRYCTRCGRSGRPIGKPCPCTQPPSGRSAWTVREAQFQVSRRPVPTRASFQLVPIASSLSTEPGTEGKETEQRYKIYFLWKFKDISCINWFTSLGEEKTHGLLTQRWENSWRVMVRSWCH